MAVAAEELRDGSLRPPSVRDVISATSMYGGHRSANSEIHSAYELSASRGLEAPDGGTDSPPAPDGGTGSPPAAPAENPVHGVDDGGNGNGCDGNGGAVPSEEPGAVGTLPVLVAPQEPPVVLMGSSGSLYASLRRSTARSKAPPMRKAPPGRGAAAGVVPMHAVATYSVAVAGALRRPRKAPTARTPASAPALAPIVGAATRGAVDARAVAIDAAIDATFKSWQMELAEHQMSAATYMREHAAAADRLGKQLTVERRGAAALAVSDQTIADARRLRLSRVESKFKNIVARWSRNQYEDAWRRWRGFVAGHRARTRWVARVTRHVIKIQNAYRHHRCVEFILLRFARAKCGVRRSHRC